MAIEMILVRSIVFQFLVSVRYVPLTKHGVRMKINFKNIDNSSGSSTLKTKISIITGAAKCPVNNQFCKVPKLWATSQSNEKVNRSCFACWLIRQPQTKVTANTEQWLATNTDNHPLYQYFQQASATQRTGFLKPQRRGGRNARLAARH